MSEITLTERRCKNCDFPLDGVINGATEGVVQCPACRKVWTIERTTDPEVKQFLRMGEHELDTCDFDKAYEAFKKASEYDKDESEAYFGMALAKHKIQYIKDVVNDCLQPICHEITDKKFTEDKLFEEALSHATSKQRKEYLKRGDEIDEVKEEFYSLEQQGIDYDCFICVKVTDDDSRARTKDYDVANDIYYDLKEKGYKPFFSERVLRNLTGSAYEAHILYALYKSECMLVVCSNEDYLQTPWVKNEYMRFNAMIAAGEDNKESDAITIVFNGKPIERLPGRQKKIQGIDFTRPDATERIVRFVDVHTPEAKKRKAEEARRKQEEAEAERRAREEQSKLIAEQMRQMQEERRQMQEERRQMQEQQRKLAEQKQSGTLGAGMTRQQLLAEMRQAEEEERLAQEEAKRKAEEDRKLKEEEERKCREEEERKWQEEEKRKWQEFLQECEVKGTTIVEYQGKGGDVVIPNRITSIGSEAFSNCTGLTSIEIPNSVESIGEGAFEGCTGLTSIEIPNSVESIGDWAFEGCTGLASITIPNSVESIGESAFAGCEGLKSIIVDPNNKTYRSENNCLIERETNKLIVACKTSVIPTSVTSISNGAFSGCTGLTSISIPNSVESIGYGAFRNCTGLKSIIVDPDNKTYRSENNCLIERETNKLIAGCKTSVIPNSVTRIGTCAFEGCTGLTSITIPNSVTSIGGWAFSGCAGLTSITIPNSVTSIGGNAFDGCTGLTSVTIPTSVTSIGGGAFKNCTGLTSVTILKRFADDMNKMLEKIFGEQCEKITFTLT